jgi:AraC-like DNA-binding protein
MPETLRGLDGGRLERSCDAVRVGTGADGLERVEVHLARCGYEPHRHDAYAIGITTAGVQTFRYRGARHVCLPGQLHVLHPDELHDGAPATDAGLCYRILYLAPRLVQEALGGRPLTIVVEPVPPRTAATAVVAALLADLDEPVDDLQLTTIAASLSDVLVALSRRRLPARRTIDLRAVELARAYLDAHATEQTPSAALERLTGLDRFTLARHFRAAFGTSPDRYRTLRRLDGARAAIARGAPLVEAAARSGFADQSHLTRQFKRAYGVTPGRWAGLTHAAAR